MLVLDTNVLSAVMRQEPDPLVVAWMDRQPRMSLWTTAVTVLEIQFGLQAMPEGRKRTRLADACEQMIRKLLEGRVLPFDADAAGHSAQLMAARKRAGRPVELRDTMIAGIALASRASLVTGNAKHFADLSVPIIDPWRDR